MNFTKCDIEIIVLFLVLLLLFCFSLKKRDSKSYNKPLAIDLDMSFILKGVACIFILTGHYVKYTNQILVHGDISKLVYYTTANIGLTWFMFFSGYGLSLKNKVGKEVFFNRLKKVWLPLLYICCIATILYALLPNRFSLTEIELYKISPFINEIKELDFIAIIKSLFGWLDWYVYCIMIFYSIYYLATYISDKFKISTTILLSLFFAVYFIWAYLYFGKEDAHWYRYIWAFLLGHIIAVQSKISKSQALISLLPFVLLILLESKFMILSYAVAILSLYIISKLGNLYTIRKNTPLLLLGGLSYYIYLSHLRIGWQIVVYTDFMNLLVFALISIIVSYVAMKGYNLIFQDKENNIK